MIRINIYQAKARLSEYLAHLADDDVIVICKRNTPVAEIRRLRSRPTRRRPIGKAAGRFAVPDSFFEPLPDDVLESFEGGSR
jgi:antitoxin (DNA-binding transcriptional repressor) of toxin-antitoxin stability system